MTRKLSYGPGRHVARALLLAALAAPLGISAAPVAHHGTELCAPPAHGQEASSRAAAQSSFSSEGGSTGYGTWFSWVLNWHAARGK